MKQKHLTRKTKRVLRLTEQYNREKKKQPGKLTHEDMPWLRLQSRQEWKMAGSMTRAYAILMEGAQSTLETADGPALREDMNDL